MKTTTMKYQKFTERLIPKIFSESSFPLFVKPTLSASIISYLLLCTQVLCFKTLSRSFFVFWNITCPYTVFINFYNVVLYFSSFQFFNISLIMTTTKEISVTFFRFLGLAYAVNSPKSEWERTLSLITTSSGSIAGFIVMG